MKMIFVALALLFLAAGCSGEDADATANKEHVWKEQADTMDKARAVEGVIQNAADAEQKQIQDEAK